jgi:hypothetical protein
MDVCITDQHSYIVSIRDYDEERKDITRPIKHYRIRKMGSGDCYISPKRTFNNMLELIEHYKRKFRLVPCKLFCCTCGLQRCRDVDYCYLYEFCVVISFLAHVTVSSLKSKNLS